MKEAEKSLLYFTYILCCCCKTETVCFSSVLCLVDIFILFKGPILHSFTDVNSLFQDSSGSYLHDELLALKKTSYLEKQGTCEDEMNTWLDVLSLTEERNWCPL